MKFYLIYNAHNSETGKYFLSLNKKIYTCIFLVLNKIL